MNESFKNVSGNNPNFPDALSGLGVNPDLIVGGKRNLPSIDRNEAAKSRAQWHEEMMLLLKRSKVSHKDADQLVAIKKPRHLEDAADDPEAKAEKVKPIEKRLLSSSERPLVTALQKFLINHFPATISGKLKEASSSAEREVLTRLALPKDKGGEGFPGKLSEYSKEQLAKFLQEKNAATREKQDKILESSDANWSCLRAKRARNSAMAPELCTVNITSG